MVVFCSFNRLRLPRSPPNSISSLLYYSEPLHKISSKSVHNFLSNVVNKQTDKQTNQRYQKHNLLCQGLSVCLFVDITQKVMNGFGCILWRGPGWNNDQELIKFWW